MNLLDLTAAIESITHHPCLSDRCQWSIPKTVHRICLGGALPSQLHESFEIFRSLNPGWEIQIYGDTDVERFIAENYGDAVYRFYLSIDPAYAAAKADFFRYLCVYHCGGVYLDLKSTVTLPLDKVIGEKDAYLLSQWPADSCYASFGIHPELTDVAGGEYQQWHIVSAPGHPYLKQVILTVMENIYKYSPRRDGVGRKSVLRVTGPIAYTLAIAPIINQHPHRSVEVLNDCGFLFSVFDDSKELNAHKKLFASHYSKIRVPLIRRNGMSGVAWQFIGRMRTFLKGRR